MMKRDRCKVWIQNTFFSTSLCLCLHTVFRQEVTQHFFEHGIICVPWLPKDRISIHYQYTAQQQYVTTGVYLRVCGQCFGSAYNLLWLQVFIPPEAPALPLAVLSRAPHHAATVSRPLAAGSAFSFMRGSPHYTLQSLRVRVRGIKANFFFFKISLNALLTQLNVIRFLYSRHTCCKQIYFECNQLAQKKLCVHN